MDNFRNSNPNTVGFHLLPTELIQNILLHLCIPEIIRMKLVSKYIFSTISDQNFIRECNSISESTTWLFIHMKRWRRDAILHGFSNPLARWFKIPVAGFLKEVISPGEDLYLLTASGKFFLFASNTHQGILAVNIVSKAVRRIPACPLGPRGTSSWRRSGMKLVTGPTGSGHFRFFFAEMVNNRPVLFEYDSCVDTWESRIAGENLGDRVDGRSDLLYLSVANGPRESVLITVGSQHDTSPAILRPRFNQGATGSCKLHVYGCGCMAIVRSDLIEGMIKKVIDIEVWGISPNGENWEFVSRVPGGLMEKIGKPYGVMMGCLEGKVGVIRLVLVSNLEGLWDIIWLNYDRGRDQWDLVPLPDCKFIKGLNMGGITFSSGVTLS